MGINSLFILYCSFNAMKIFVDISARLELQDSLVTCLVVDNLHRAVLLHPQFTDDDVMNGAIDVRPSVGFSPIWQYNCHETLRLNLNKRFEKAFQS